MAPDSPADERARAAFYAAAACRDQPTIHFDVTDPEDQLAPQALAACAECTVVTMCLVVVRPAETWFDGIAAGQVWWNGVARGATRGSNPPMEYPQCGTEYGYEVHRRNNEKACDRCRNAKSTARRERRERAKIETVEEPQEAS